MVKFVLCVAMLVTLGLIASTPEADAETQTQTICYPNGTCVICTTYFAGTPNAVTYCN